MFYVIYKIINLVNGKIYVGVHRTKNVNDSYMGSGLLIKKAISKYGKYNFKKEILFVFDNENAAYAKESEIVNEEFLLREDVYNVTIGGKKSPKPFKKGFIVCKDSEGKVFEVERGDVRLKLGELIQVGSKKGLIRMIRENGIYKEFPLELRKKAE